MIFKTPLGRKLIICIVVIIGLALGAFGIGQAIASNLKNDKEIIQVFPKNTNGQTYGSSANCNSLETEPDLVQAIGLDGTEGYVFSKDLNGEMPKTPEEALAKQKKLSPDGRLIPLYAVDGKTIIGEFKVGGNIGEKRLKNTD